MTGEQAQLNYYSDRLRAGDRGLTSKRGKSLCLHLLIHSSSRVHIATHSTDIEGSLTGGKLAGALS
jgi:hypothetical protein